MSASSASSRLPAWVQRQHLLVVGSGLAIAVGILWLQSARVAGERAAARAFPVVSGSRAMPGLAAKVDVIRDARGVPHIEAVAEQDAIMALGLVHAQDRLGQMLWLRRLAEGRTAEVVGESGLAPDRMARTLGLAYHAREQTARLSPDVLAVLEAYARGINSRLGRIRLGIEEPPLALRGSPEAFEDWHPAHTLAVLKLVAWSSSNLLETGLVLDDLIRFLGGGPARPFFPAGTGGWGVEIPGAEIPSRAPGPGGGRVGRGVDELAFPSRALTESVAIRGGSAFAISGRHTQGGAPILVADLRLPTTAPSLIYEAHLRGGALEVAGATIPGIPVVWAGRNQHVAWSATPANAVTVDLYKEIVRPAEGLYQKGSGWSELTVRREVIDVRQASGPLRQEELAVRSTRHGPLVNQLLRSASPGVAARSRTSSAQLAAAEGGEPAPVPFGALRGPLALRWTGMLPGDGIGSLLQLMKARSSAELVAALEQHHEPVLAVVYADDAGDVGMQVAGWLPQRRLATEGVPVPGRMRMYDWHTPIEYSALPATRIPPDGSARSAGWVIAADGTLGDGLTGAEIEWLWRTGQHHKRLAARLTTETARLRELGTKLDLTGAVALQLDEGVEERGLVIPALLRLSQLGATLRPEAREIAQLLGRWDGSTGPDSQGAAAYHVMMEHLIEELFRDRLGEDLFERYVRLPRVRPAALVEGLILTADRTGRRGGWSDVSRMSDAVRLSLRKTWVSLAYRLGPRRRGWTWGRLHQLRFTAFGAFGPTPAEVAGRLPPAGVGGDETALGGLLFDYEAGGYPAKAVSTYRMVVDLAERDRMRSSLSPGQSEHLRHPHFADGVARWLTGRPSILPTSHQLLEDLLSSDEAGTRLLLEPPT